MHCILCCREDHLRSKPETRIVQGDSIEIEKWRASHLTYIRSWRQFTVPELLTYWQNEHPSDGHKYNVSYHQTSMFRISEIARGFSHHGVVHAGQNCGCRYSCGYRTHWHVHIHFRFFIAVCGYQRCKSEQYQTAIYCEVPQM